MFKTWFTRSAAILLILFIGTMSFSPVSAQAASGGQNTPTTCILYVSQKATGANNGTSWSDAYTSLQTAMRAATSGCQIKVAEGTYAPNSIGDNTVSFQLESGVAIYGGYSGTGVNPDERDLARYPTALTGNVGITIVNGNIKFIRSKHVVIDNGANSTAILDGFTIEWGAATDTSGIGQAGGGMFLTGSPTLSDLAFENNTAAEGAAIALMTGSPKLTNILFYKNTATLQAADLYNDAGSPTLVNITSYGNTTQGVSTPAAIYNFDGHPTITNTLMWNDSGLEIVSNSTPSLISYSMIQGCKHAGVWNSTCGGNANGNLTDTDPKFVDAANGNLHLGANSPFLDKGDNTAATAVVNNDLDLAPRVMKSISSAAATVDLGAYERPTVIYVNPGAAGTNNGTSWTNAYTILQSALAQARSLESDSNWVEVWVTSGRYIPSTTGNRVATFLMASNTSLLGGFDAKEVDSSQRNWTKYPTVLSGDLLGNDGNSFTNTGDNSYHVVMAQDVSGHAVIDGLTIANGEATTLDANYQGAGLWIQESDLWLANLSIAGNQAMQGAGTIIMQGSLVSIVNSKFFNNAASSKGGGLALFDTSQVVLYNPFFAENTAEDGGAIFGNGTALMIINGTFNQNTAVYGGAIFNDNLAANNVLVNSILWGDTPNEVVSGGSYPLTISYSLVQGCLPGGAWVTACGVNGGHNLTDTDPQWVNAGEDDYTLKTGSPAIDAGNYTGIPAFLSTDLGGNPRFQNGAVDLGAYEYDNIAPLLTNFSKMISYGGNGAIPFSQADFTSHYFDANADALAEIKITSVPSFGGLFLGSTSIGVNAVIPLAVLNTLIYVPNPGFPGTDSFTWNAFDGQAWASNPATVAITKLADLSFLPTILR